MKATSLRPGNLIRYHVEKRARGVSYPLVVIDTIVKVEEISDKGIISIDKFGKRFCGQSYHFRPIHFSEKDIYGVSDKLKKRVKLRYMHQLQNLCADISGKMLKIDHDLKLTLW